jgi:hypothetical protein
LTWSQTKKHNTTIQVGQVATMMMSRTEFDRYELVVIALTVAKLFEKTLDYDVLRSNARIKIIKLANVIGTI